MKLSLLKSLFIDSLLDQYSFDEAEALFFTTLNHVEQKNRTHLLFGESTFFKDQYFNVVNELKKNRPIQYVLGTAPFYGLEIQVNEATLIPRPETEELVHWVIQENKNTNLRILDIGTGSGCIALALKSCLSQAIISGCDISLDAIELASQNAKNLKLDVTFFQCDIINEEIPDGDIIISNPPYIAKSEKEQMDKNVLDYEPHLALFVENEDPLLFYKRIITKAKKQRSTLYFETSEFYYSELTEWLKSQELRYQWKSDFQGKNRMLKVWW
ncbi:MAG: peptide chain release factor N(5)-glutamine methyltransferase [Bacteroidia bacterium]|nr:peptide chain release factor N(5)-glutamine methyltransferase [Bacteroidia bacterium]